MVVSAPVKLRDCCPGRIFSHCVSRFFSFSCELFLLLISECCQKVDGLQFFGASWCNSYSIDYCCRLFQVKSLQIEWAFCFPKGIYWCDCVKRVGWHKCFFVDIFFSVTIKFLIVNFPFPLVILSWGR